MSVAPDHVLLTRGEVCDILRVGPRTVRRYGAEGKLEVVKLNARTFRYTAASVAALTRPERAEGSDV
jgi:predicted site-specific integrase-resolvase